MAIVTTGLDDTFDQWRQNTNTTANSTGDLTLLSTTDKTNVVAAINETAVNGNSFSVAMAIALG